MLFIVMLSICDDDCIALLNMSLSVWLVVLTQHTGGVTAMRTCTRGTRMECLYACLEAIFLREAGHRLILDSTVPHSRVSLSYLP
jgi:hypothetical protein